MQKEYKKNAEKSFHGFPPFLSAFLIFREGGIVTAEKVEKSERIWKEINKLQKEE